MRQGRCARGAAYSAAVLSGVLATACATSSAQPPVATPTARVQVSIERKAGWILRLEQQRTLSDPTEGADLLTLAEDPDSGVRRRAVIAIGRVGMAEGVAPLTKALADPEEPVRAAAAFALGLLARPESVGALVAILKDPSPLVRSRAVQALGLVGDAAAAPAIADGAGSCAALIAGIPPDDEEPKTPDVEACRASVVALVRLRQYEAIARVVLNQAGEPVSQWWPVAFALQRSADPRAAASLAALATGPGVYTPAFAIRGLAAIGDGRVASIATAVLTRPDADVRLKAESIRALGRVKSTAAVPALIELIVQRATPPNLVLEAITALGAIGDSRAFELMLDLFAAESPIVRVAAMNAAARMDAEGFLLAVSSVDRDTDWQVRAGLATALAGLPPDRVRLAVEELSRDQDVRVQVPALRALVRVAASGADERILKALQAPDFALRAAAAALVGERRPPGGAAALAEAYARGESDATHAARVAALDAIARYPIEDARPVLMRGLADREWAVRLAAARALKAAGIADASPVRPAPIRQDHTFFESDRLLRPEYTPQVYVDTPRGTIQLELNMIDAPFASLNFMELARAGFFNGLRVHRLIPNFVIQAGDPRGDGEGGPGYAIRDERSPLPFVRGTLGMALDGRDTGGSQFFISLSPQPHLDGEYTVFGRVVAGWDVLDRVFPGDVITRVRVWDGAR